MYELKTRATPAKVEDFLAAVESEERRRDCEQLIRLMKKVTGCPPVMWGPSIIGFGQYHYRYASGHEGDMCLLGFSPRKGDLSLYLLPCEHTGEFQALLAKLGKHKAGKSCLYLRRLADIDMKVLEEMARLSVADTRRRYPDKG